MEDIYAYINEKLDPRLKRKCVYNLAIDKQGAPYIFIEYKCGEQELNLFDYVGNQNNETEKFAAELTRLTRDNLNLGSLNTDIKPIVLDYTKENLKFSYGLDIETIGPVELSKDILLGFIVDQDKNYSNENKIYLLKHCIDAVTELHKNGDYAFSINHKDIVQESKRI